MTQKSKFLQWIDFRVRITIQDGRMMVGTFLAYDKHMNVVLSDTDEYRIVKKKDVQKQIKRTLGLVIIRGENIISLTAEAPPAQKVQPYIIQAKKDDVTGVGKATAVTRAGTIPTQLGAKGQLPTIPNFQQSLVSPTGPLPNLSAPNISVQLPKPPTMPPL